MSMTIGRAGLTIPLGDPISVQVSGDQLRIAGEVSAEEVSDAVALRQQLAGLVGNPWEEIVPVTWTEDPALDGFYRVGGVDVGTIEASYVAARFPFSATLSRVGGAPSTTEVITRGAVRYNVGAGFTFVSHAESTPWLALPSVAAGCSLTSPFTSRIGPGGHVNVWVPPSQDLYDARCAFRLAPAAWYAMGATVSVAGTPIVGSYAPDGLPELSNGLLRVNPDGVNGLLSIACPRSSSRHLWATPVEFRLGYAPSGTFTHALAPANFVGWSVVWNDPTYAAVALMVTYAPGSSVTAHAIVTIGLRRGSQLVDVSIRASDARNWAIRPATTTAVEVLNAGGGSDPVGARQTVDDGHGNRFVVLCSLPHNVDTSTGLVWSIGSSRTRDFAVGFEIGGDTATSPDRAVDLANQWFAPTVERVRVVR